MWTISMVCDSLCDRHRRLRVWCVCVCVRSVVLNFKVWWVFIWQTPGEPHRCSALWYLLLPASAAPLKIPSSTLTAQPQPNSLTLITCYCPGFWRSSSQFIALERELKIVSCRAVKWWQKRWTYGWISQRHVQVRFCPKISFWKKSSTNQGCIYQQ